MISDCFSAYLFCISLSRRHGLSGQQLHGVIRTMDVKAKLSRDDLETDRKVTCYAQSAPKDIRVVAE
jgi:hypothetical protein